MIKDMHYYLMDPGTLFLWPMMEGQIYVIGEGTSGIVWLGVISRPQDFKQIDGVI